MKTLSDDDAPKLVLDRVERTTISAFNRLPRHCQGGPDKRSWPEEFKVYEVVGIVKHVRAEEDRDVHIVLSDPDDPQSTVIVEIADPECSGAADSPHVLTLQAARAAFTSLLRSGRTRDPQPLLGRRVKVRGLGFYDFDHGQTGRSANCIELHPVIAIEAVPERSP